MELASVVKTIEEKLSVKMEDVSIDQYTFHFKIEDSRYLISIGRAIINETVDVIRNVQ